MKEIKNVLLVGIGAVGAAVAKRLYDWSSESLWVLAGGERLERYKKNGIIINGERYVFQYADPDHPDQPADLIIVAVKQYGLEDAIANMRPFVGEETIILSIMNGITSEEMLGAAFGMEKVLFGVVIGIDGNRDRNQIKFINSGTIAFGEPDNAVWSDKVKATARLFDQAGIVYNVPEDMMHTLWFKFMVNIGVNQASVALMARYRVFRDIPDAEAVAESAMWEVIRLAEKIGVTLGESDIERWRQILSGMNPDGYTSMMDDLLGGRPTELDMLAGTMMRLGKKHGVPTPVNEMLYHLIRAREQMGQNV